MDKMANVRLYFAGFTFGSIFTFEYDNELLLDQFTEVPFTEVKDIEVSWNYCVLWNHSDLYIIEEKHRSYGQHSPELLKIPGVSSARCKAVAGAKEDILILTTTNEIWRYRVYEKSWKKVRNFISINKGLKDEYPTKILHGNFTLVLTNLGRLFNVPILVEMPKGVKLVDVACGFDFTIMLTENGDVYSMGTGLRGQLGHNTVKCHDDPKLVEALAGLNVVQISAGGWQSAAVTDQGDLYIWGWMLHDVFYVPTVVNFEDEKKRPIEINVKKVQCGNRFTICLTDDGSLWGCGCNNYGQLGQPREKLKSSKTFIKLDIPSACKNIKDFKCQQWATLLWAE